MENRLEFLRNPLGLRHACLDAMTALPPISDALIQQLDVPGPRYTSYPTVPE